MPLGLDPEALIIIGVITGMGGMVTYAGFHYAEKAGPELTLSDMLPMPPPHPPLPRFLYKPKLLEELRRGK